VLHVEYQVSGSPPLLVGVARTWAVRTVGANSTRCNTAAVNLTSNRRRATFSVESCTGKNRPAPLSVPNDHQGPPIGDDVSRGSAAWGWWHPRRHLFRSRLPVSPQPPCAHRRAGSPSLTRARGGACGPRDTPLPASAVIAGLCRDGPAGSSDLEFAIYERVRPGGSQRHSPQLCWHCAVCVAPDLEMRCVRILPNSGSKHNRSIAGLNCAPGKARDQGPVSFHWTPAKGVPAVSLPGLRLSSRDHPTPMIRCGFAADSSRKKFFPCFSRPAGKRWFNPKARAPRMPARSGAPGSAGQGRPGSPPAFAAPHCSIADRLPP
jgi:hypothetical protein